ncbi:MAG: EAL domain-containing protein [Candidatus Omnitrophota bacterium]
MMKTNQLILIIDDESDFIETMRFFLQNAGFRIITASNGKEGLEKADSMPDLILTDLRMPGMDGHEVCKHLKENEKTRNIPIIMLTLNDDTIDKVEALNMGVADYVGKHFPFDEILARIKASLRKTDLPNAFADNEKNEKILQLRSIIDKKDIRILYQPIISMADKKPIGYEALSRGPKGSFFEAPVNLFGLAKDVNMFSELDVLCRNISTKNAEKFLKKDQLLFLNADPITMETSHFKDLEFLIGSSLPPSQVCLEISEQTFVTNFEKISRVMNMLKDKGIVIAIDDVGAGYSSLRSIAELKPDFIKIDIDIVRSVDKNEVKGSIVQALVILGDKLQCSLIAEGIETQEECKALLNMGVKYGQGFLFAKPTENP